MKRRTPFHDEQRRIHDALEFVRALHRDMFIQNRTSAHICEIIDLIIMRFAQETFLIREVSDAVVLAAQ